MLFVLSLFGSFAPLLYHNRMSMFKTQCIFRFLVAIMYREKNLPCLYIFLTFVLHLIRVISSKTSTTIIFATPVSCVSRRTGFLFFWQLSFAYTLMTHTRTPHTVDFVRFLINLCVCVCRKNYCWFTFYRFFTLFCFTFYMIFFFFCRNGERLLLVLLLLRTSRFTFLL